MKSVEVSIHHSKCEENICQTDSICLHTFSDLSHVPPAAFVYLLKECYICGSHKATHKFRVLQQQVTQALYNSPQPDASTFVVQCLYLLPSLGPPYTEGFSHLLLSSLRRVKTSKSVLSDSLDARHHAVQLSLDILAGFVPHEDRILIKVLEIYDLELKDFGEAICGLEHDGMLDIAKAHMEHYIFNFIKAESYMTAVTLLERFQIHLSSESLLVKMMQNNQFKAAEKWATFMGKPMLCLLVQTYLDMKMLKNAYNMITRNNLKQEFPYVYHLYKESSLKKLAEKGCWDIAESRTNKDRQLLEYLVYLAMEAGYMEKVNELCERYSLQGFAKIKVPDATACEAHFLDSEKLVLDEIIWIDELDGLLSATNHIEGSKLVGIDCEWKPNYEKGSKPNKVSIIQIASENKVYIFDLIKLYENEKEVLNSCFRRILCSPNILKLGYNLQCDLHQLSESYGDLECFRYYEMLLDIQKLFNERNGGLSGLAKKILGAGLNKTRRNSNWEQRPLSQNQLEYAALDAAVLLHIFYHVRGQPHSTSREVECKVEWKSHIVSHIDNTNRKKSS
ncbi:DNA helicase protein [Dioscorea alata]|uniref:DNA helicase protein n=1 Tax=Dioscorea alata TaxID=55571 RepID=A0ACB7VQ69_DIOAL|nr:DNA helicase protein [Dioscorea alata]